MSDELLRVLNAPVDDESALARMWEEYAMSGVDESSDSLWFDFILFGTHHVHRITHESLIMTYFQCGPLMTCGV